MPATYRLGRQPNDPRKPRLRLDEYQVTPPAPPASADWVSQIKTWPMSMNDQIGDCTAAGAGHIAQLVNWYGRGQDAPVSDTDILAMYEAISGYRPGHPNTDVGATLQDALGYWRTTGVGGNTIAAFAQLDPRNLDLVRDCINLFGAVYTGLNVPKSAMDQTNAGQPWAIVPGSPILGGHCVPLAAYDQNSFTAVTWGQTQVVELAFYERYFDEVWVAIDLDWAAATGYSPQHLNTDTLNADFQALTGQPGPFPVQPAPQPTPQPTPTPTPAPQPTPKHDPADLAMAHATYVWRKAKGI